MRLLSRVTSWLRLWSLRSTADRFRVESICWTRRAKASIVRTTGRHDSMRNSTLSLAVLGTVAALALSACGSGGSSNSSSGGGGSSGGAKGVSAMCKLANPPKSSAVAPSSGAPAKVANASGKVGVILRDTTSSTRYTLYDAPLLSPSTRPVFSRTFRTRRVTPPSFSRSRRA